MTSITLTFDVVSALTVVLGAAMLGIGSELGKDFYNHLKPAVKNRVKRVIARDNHV